MNNNTHNTELGHSPDALAQRRAELLALLAQTAPELMSDHQLDLAKLKDLLEPERLVDERQEHYELTWAGKAAARREIQKTSSHTLRPDANNPPSAQHMLIEGENLEVLRVLQKSYYGKVKMIYIDPPYNTGNDSFVYQPMDDNKAPLGVAFACVLSDSEVESQFAHDCAVDERVRFFFKLPPKFKIPTPLGSYNPDWAVVFDGDTRVYFVAETKSSTVEADRRMAENLKIRCGRKHFALEPGVAFKVVTRQHELGQVA